MQSNFNEHIDYGTRTRGEWFAEQAERDEAMQAWAIAMIVTVVFGGVAGAYLLARWDDLTDPLGGNRRLLADEQPDRKHGGSVRQDGKSAAGPNSNPLHSVAGNDNSLRFKDATRRLRSGDTPRHAGS